MLSSRRRITSYDAGMLALADRLFRDHDDLPVRTVLDAITGAHADLSAGLAGGARPAPEAVAAAAARQLGKGTVTHGATSQRG